MLDRTSTISIGEPDAVESGHVRFGKRSSEKEHLTRVTSPTTYFTARPVWAVRRFACIPDIVERNMEDLFLDRPAYPGGLNWARMS
jgi:hypothetical protein